MDNPLVSIIIPTYNRENILQETLDSVKNQSYENWECLIVDDGSTDGTIILLENYIQKDLRFNYFRRPNNRLKGANACRNYGFQQSTGEYINWLDSDDLLHKDHLKVHLEMHHKNDIDVSISTAGLFERKIGDIEGNWAEINPNKNAIDEMISGKISWGTPCALWKRDILPIFPFVERLHCSQEWTFNLFMLINEISFKLCDERTVSVRRHEVRIGKSKDAKKFYSELESRLLIHNELRNKNRLNNENDFYLIAKMLQGFKKTIRTKNIVTILLEMKLFMNVFPYTNYKFSLLKSMFIGFPIYFALSKGEILFKMNTKFLE